jgi:hypothetical protein
MCFFQLLRKFKVPVPACNHKNLGGEEIVVMYSESIC